MKKIVIIVLTFLLCVFYSSAYSANWVRNGGITEKGWNDSKPLVFGFLGDPPANNDNCNAGGDDMDQALSFDISIFSHLAGSSFDVNNIYVDGIATGEYALNVWQINWIFKTGLSDLPPLNGSDWSNRDIVSVCVGRTVQNLTFNNQLESIVFWYDGSVQTTYHPTPQNGEDDSEDYSGPDVDTSTVSGSLLVSNTGQTLADVTGPGSDTPPTDTPTPGLPDFIITKLELSNYNPKKTDSIKMKGQSKNVGDDDVGSDDKIESRFYLSKGYKEDSHSEWIRVGRDYTKGSNLDPGETHSETEGLNLWDYSIIEPGKTYNIVYCIDRDKDKDNGDGDYPEIHKSNNCSSEAVFTVQAATPPPPVNHQPVGYIDSANCSNITGWTRDPDTTSSIRVHLYANGEAGQGGTIVANEMANAYRSDLPFTDKNHGFSISVPGSLKDNNFHNIYAYAIDSQGGANPLLIHSPRGITCSPTPPPPPPPEYNLQLSSIGFSVQSRPKLWPGEAFDISATAYNLGDNLLSSVSLGYYLDDIFITSHSISASSLTNGAYVSDTLISITAPTRKNKLLRNQCS